jgi:hypothetical protein
MQSIAVHCETSPLPLHTGIACTDWSSVFAQAMSTMLEALQRNLEEECEGRKAEAAARTSAQDRCSAADERVTKLEWESNQATASLQRKVCSFSSASLLWLQTPIWPCSVLLHACSAHARTRQATPGM